MTLKDEWNTKAQKWHKETGNRVMVGAVCPTCYKVIPASPNGSLAWPDVKYCPCGNTTSREDNYEALFGSRDGEILSGFSASVMEIAE